MLRTLLLALAFMFSLPLAAQDAPLPPDAPDPLEAIGALVDDVGRPAFDASAPGGPGHFGLVGQDGSGHTALLRQHGAGNLAVLYQLGAGQTATLEQVGAENALALRLLGEGGIVYVHQLGDGNYYLLDLTGSDFAHTVLQVGDDLRATQTGATDAPFDIKQRGAGMSLFIQH